MEDLIRRLRLAHAGEWGAIHAYLGHRRSLDHRPGDRAGVTLILKEEIEHRRCIGGMLAELGVGPDPKQERLMYRIGRTIGLLCRLGGWLVPMYGAGRLESQNAVEYELLARSAWRAGHVQFVEPLLHMAEVEWDHELYFRRQASSHWLWKFIPKWPASPPRAHIRESFARFIEEHEESRARRADSKEPGRPRGVSRVRRLAD